MQTEANKENFLEVVTLTSSDLDQIDSGLDEIMAGQKRIGVTQIEENVNLFKGHLPRKIRERFWEFTRNENHSGILVREFPIDDSEIGPTPTGLPSDEEALTIGKPEVFHFLLASLLGEPIGWISQQKGRVLNDILPIEANADRLISSGSNVLFDLHTEDAFHPEMPDFIGLMCLRNPQAVGTIVSSLEWFDIPDEIRETLLQPRFFVGVNPAHEVDQPDIDVPILFGGSRAPYMRVNLNLHRAREGDIESQEALDFFSRALVENQQQILLEKGDYLYLDNFRIAHGRGVYNPNYDGGDRWLKRLTIMQDLRRVAEFRIAQGSRILDPRGLVRT